MHQPKKFLIIYILEILKKYTDENHRLSQKEIIDILKKDYDMTVERKAIRRNIINLIELGYNIEYSEKVRNVLVKNDLGKTVSDKNSIWTDFYIERDFTDSELKLLIDGLLFSKHISSGQCKELVKKLENLSSKYFYSGAKHISTSNEQRSSNPQLFLNIELLDEAITNNKKVSFKYLEYDTDKKQHVKRRDDGTERIYIISPYQMAIREDKYYLICNYDKYDDISNYRINRITELNILEDTAKPFSNLKWAQGKPLNLEEYMRKHPYMYSSDDILVKFRIPLSMISDVIDIFGKDVIFFDKDEAGVSVIARTNEKSVEQFAKSFLPDVVVLYPERLKDKIKNDLEKSLRKYNQNEK